MVLPIGRHHIFNDNDTNAKGASTGAAKHYYEFYGDKSVMDKSNFIVKGEYQNCAYIIPIQIV